MAKDLKKENSTEEYRGDCLETESMVLFSISHHPWQPIRVQSLYKIN
jgi:hypothetical protein